MMQLTSDVRKLQWDGKSFLTVKVLGLLHEELAALLPLPLEQLVQTLRHGSTDSAGERCCEGVGSVHRVWRPQAQHVVDTCTCLKIIMLLTPVKKF
jgi:hypothetical protein